MSSLAASRRRRGSIAYDKAVAPVPDAAVSAAAAAAAASPGRRAPTFAEPGSPAAAAAAAATVAASPGRRAPTFAESGSPSAAAAAAASAAAPAAAVAPVPSAAGQWRPPSWERVLANIEAMRAGRDAPVDTMGCDQCADATASPAARRYQILLSLMLSSQTKDETTFAAMQRLRAAGAATPEAVVALTQAQLEALLHPVSFYKNKSKFILATTRLLLEKYAGDIPDTSAGLIELPGVGPKMAHLALQSAWGKQEGIGVDIHVHRISNRLGWVGASAKATTASPEATRAALESWLPRDRWSTINLLLVGFGQQVCTPLAPHCGVCLNKDLCPVGTGARSEGVAAAAARKRAR